MFTDTNITSWELIRTLWGDMKEGRTSRFAFEGLIERTFSMGESRFFFYAGCGRGGGGGKVRG